MDRIIVPKVTLQQELIVPALGVTISSMNDNAERIAFSDRLNEICDEMKVPPKGQARQGTVARLFGVTQKGARKWLENEGYPSLDKAREIAVWAGVQIEWLLSGRGLKYVFDQNTHPSTELTANEQPQRTYSVTNVSSAPDIKGKIPLISYVQAGAWNEAVDIYEPGYAERWLPFLKTNGERTFALRVEGDSMTAPYGKSYPHSCIVFINPDQRNPVSGARIIAKLEGSNLVTFKVFIEDAGRRWLKPLNPQHPPILEPFQVVGTVIGKWEDD